MVNGGLVSDRETSSEYLRSQAGKCDLKVPHTPYRPLLGMLLKDVAGHSVQDDQGEGL